MHNTQKSHDWCHSVQQRAVEERCKNAWFARSEYEKTNLSGISFLYDDIIVVHNPATLKIVWICHVNWDVVLQVVLWSGWITGTNATFSPKICTILTMRRQHVNHYRLPCWSSVTKRNRWTWFNSQPTFAVISTSVLTPVFILVQKWLRKQVQGKGYFWIGLTDEEEENVWRWIDGTEPAFTYVLNSTVACWFCLSEINTNNIISLPSRSPAACGSLASLTTGATIVTSVERTVQGSSMMPCGMTSSVKIS